MHVLLHFCPLLWCETNRKHKLEFVGAMMACFVQDEGDKVIVCERGDLVFVFNFNPTQSFTDYRVGCKNSGSYKVGGFHPTGSACAQKIALCYRILFCSYTELEPLHPCTHHSHKATLCIST